MDNSPAISVSHLSKHYHLYARPIDRLKQGLLGGVRYRTHKALEQVSLTVNKGEMVGIVGQNGSGKSTLLQIICGTLQPSSGTVAAHGRVSALLELGAGFNPEFTGHENVRLNAAILGLTDKELKAKYEGIIAFSGLSEASLNQPVKTYSSGMYVRLAFAVAVAIDPDIFIVDEALAVGDEAFQRKCYARIRELQRQGATVLFVSHAARTVLSLCDRVLWLEQGRLAADGDPKTVMGQYQKFLYATAAEQKKLLEEIAGGGEKKQGAAAAQGFDASLQPETTIHYASNGALIEAVELRDGEGKRVNLLKTGETYRLRYRVLFETNASQVRFGMMIKTLSGNEIGGASLQDKPLPKVEKGQAYEVEIAFTNHLLEGTYFFNCGCSGEVSGARTFLHRIHDAAMFKVLPEGRSNATALVDLQPEYTVRKVEHA